MSTTSQTEEAEIVFCLQVVHQRLSLGRPYSFFPQRPARRHACCQTRRTSTRRSALTLFPTTSYKVSCLLPSSVYIGLRCLFSSSRTLRRMISDNAMPPSSFAFSLLYVASEIACSRQTSTALLSASAALMNFRIGDSVNRDR